VNEILVGDAHEGTSRELIETDHRSRSELLSHEGRNRVDSGFQWQGGFEGHLGAMAPETDKAMLHGLEEDRRSF
jgi:hypothetical protein